MTMQIKYSYLLMAALNRVFQLKLKNSGCVYNKSLTRAMQMVVPTSLIGNSIVNIINVDWWKTEKKYFYKNIFLISSPRPSSFSNIIYLKVTIVSLSLSLVMEIREMM